MRRQWAALNVTVHQPERAAPDSEGLLVWERNWPALLALIDCATQWRVGVGTSGCVYFGLDYAACRALLGSKRWKAVKDDLGVMERHALPILNGGEAPVDRPAA